SVVDVTRQEHALAVVDHVANWVVLVPAIATEVHRVEALLRIAGEELLPVDGDGAAARGLEGGVGMPRTREELMQLEGEEAADVAVFGTAAVDLGHAGNQEQVT